MTDARTLAVWLAVLAVASAVPPAVPAATYDGCPDGCQIETTRAVGQDAASNGSDVVRVVVLFEDRADRSPRTVRSAGGTVVGGQSVDVTPVLFARLPRSAIPALESNPRVSRVDVDERLVETAGSNQTTPWGVERVDARTAAAAVEDDALDDVRIAVLDSGIDDVEDLNGTVVWGVNATASPVETGRDTATDDDGHGTKVASVIAAADDDTGVVGVAPGAKLYSIRVIDADGVGLYSWLVEGIDRAIKGPDGTLGTDDDADVVTMSVGADTDRDFLRDAIANASDHAVLVASAGNEGDSDPDSDVTYPAAYGEVIAVGATDRDDDVAPFSADGAEVELAAPGRRVPATTMDGTVENASGTSFAAPHVAGTAALVIAADLEDGRRDLTPADVRDRLNRTAEDIGPPGRDRLTGHGLLAAAGAVPGVGPPEVGLDGVSVPATVTAGENLTAAVTVENAGGNGTATVSVGVDADGDGAVGPDDAVIGRNLTLAAGERTTVSLGGLSTEGLTPGTVDVLAETGTDTATTTVDVVAPRANVSLVPENDSVRAGDERTFDLVVRNAEQAIGSYSLSVETDDPAVANITNATGTLNGTTGVTNVAADGSSASLVGSVPGANATGPLTIGRITVTGVSPGRTALTVAVTTIATDSSVEYTIDSSRNATLEVQRAPPGDITGNGNPAGDPNGDGLYEDVDGDGRFTAIDVSALLSAYLDAGSDDLDPAFFDFSGDGSVGATDVTALLDALLA